MTKHFFSRYSQSQSQPQKSESASMEREADQVLPSCDFANDGRDQSCANVNQPEFSTPKKLKPSQEKNAEVEADEGQEQDQIVWEISPPMKKLQGTALSVENNRHVLECSTPEVADLTTPTLVRCKSEAGTAAGEKSSSTAGKLERWLAFSPLPPAEAPTHLPLQGAEIVSETSSEVTTRLAGDSPGEDDQNILDLLQRVKEATQKESPADGRPNQGQPLATGQQAAMDTSPASLDGSASPKYSRGVPSHIVQLLEGADMDAFFETPEKKISNTEANQWLPEDANAAVTAPAFEIYEDREAGRVDGSHGRVQPLHTCLHSNATNDCDCGPVNIARLSSDADYGSSMMSTMDPQVTRAGLGGLQHFTVLDVVERGAPGQRPYGDEKVLALLSRDDKQPFEVILQDEWFSTPVSRGDVVSVVGEFDSESRCVVDARSNFIILHPDVLVSGSRVGSSFMCPRRSVLDERVQSNDSNAAALFGTLLHQLFQAGLRDKSCSTSFLLKEITTIVGKNIEGIYAVGEDDESAVAHLMERIPNIQKFVSNFLRSQPPPVPNLAFGGSAPAKSVCITDVLDIEESVWSPRFGLKGMMDASVQALQRDPQSAAMSIMPFELKTGKWSTGQTALEHRAQVMLYTLLMSDRYSTHVNSAIIHYLHNGTTQGVQVVHRELLGIVMRRNEHANSLVTAGSTQMLPELIQNPHVCRSCHQAPNCLVYHKLVENGGPSSSGLPDMFDLLTSHLSATHAAFLSTWSQLVDLEAQDSEMTRRQIWTVAGEKREAQGGCISRLLLDPADVIANKYSHASNLDRYTYTFSRLGSQAGHGWKVDAKENQQPDCKPSHGCLQQPQQGSAWGLSTSAAPPSLLALPFTKGDRVVLSTEGGQYAICQGAVIENVADQSVQVSFPRRLRLGGNRQVSASERLLRQVYRLDKDDSGSIYAILRANLLTLFTTNSAAMARRRDLIVDLAVPEFKEEGGWEGAGLNAEQVGAVRKVMSAVDYALIVGMPGAGKSTCIVHMVRSLAAMGLSVLLTSYTNTAVDNLLLKLMDAGVEFVRVGRADAVHPRLLPRTLCAQGLAFSSVDALQRAAEGAQVVGATCLGVEQHPLFARRKLFDVCIVDEASQITLPACLGPLRFASRFVLVGDHKQLPPLVKSERARQGGLGRSLFEALCEGQPQSVVHLATQYRMCADIMALSNQLVYGGQLKCATSLLHAATLRFSEDGPRRLLALHPSLPPWLLSALQPDCRVLFLNTDATSAKEWRQAETRRNEVEARLAVCLAKLLYLRGMQGSTAVISPYVHQVRLIRQLAATTGVTAGPGMEVDTIDRFQGRDADCIILSLVCSDKDRPTVGRHLADLRRLNVALTRARGKLLMVGSRATLQSDQVTRKFVALVESRGWMLDLPPSSQAVCDAVLAESAVDKAASAAGNEEKAGVGDPAGESKMRSCSRVKGSRGAAVLSSLRKL